MAKKSAIARNNKRIKLVALYARQRKELKRKLLDVNLSDEEYFDAQRKLAKLPRNSSRVRVRNRCAITGRARGFHGWFGISRLQLRDMASFGEIPGITKSSW
ncbi:MAG: 30S ribosomal protein S14 [Puniceicoccales bacterium]|jgi:small subunit ribosomal protein S14|nr:30S ribosomal protein S14 [Puniceicoccales bacterium]